MWLLLSLMLISFATSLFLTPLCRNLALRLGFVDLPDNSRKIHRIPVPRIGGVAIALSYIAAYAGVLLWRSDDSDLWALLSTARSLIPATVLVFVVGLGDDLFNLSPLHKLAGELLAAILAISSGVMIHSIGGFSLNPWIGAPLTIVWLVGCANAVNLVDGVDGLASGIGLLAAATTVVAALLDGNFPLAIATVPLVGALIGFLRYNFNPASIFLGDSGSLMLGFLLGCFGVIWTEKAATVLGMTAPLIAFAIPLLDTVLAIQRRILRRQPICGADRSHIHHRLLARGLTPRRAVLLLYAIACVAGAVSLLLGRVQGQWEGAIILLFVGGAIAGVEQLGYAELKTARALVMKGTFLEVLNAQLAIQSLETGLRGASSPEECWALSRPPPDPSAFIRSGCSLPGIASNPITDSNRTNPGPFRFPFPPVIGSS